MDFETKKTMKGIVAALEKAQEIMADASIMADSVSRDDIDEAITELSDNIGDLSSSLEAEVDEDED